MFAAICPETNFSLGIVVFTSEILKYKAKSPCTVPVSCLTTTIVTEEQARLPVLVSAKRWREIDFTSLDWFARLQREDSYCIVHFPQMTNDAFLCYWCILAEWWNFDFQSVVLFIPNLS